MQTFWGYVRKYLRREKVKRFHCPASQNNAACFVNHLKRNFFREVLSKKKRILLCCTSLKFTDGFIIRKVILELAWKGEKEEEGPFDIEVPTARTRVTTIRPSKKSEVTRILHSSPRFHRDTHTHTYTYTYTPTVSVGVV